MPTRKPLPPEDKLAALQKADPVHRWKSLDDRLSCVLCEREFTGRQLEVSISALGRIRLRCPSEGCASTPNEWVHTGNPLVSAKAWRDWERVFTQKKAARTRRHQSPTSQNYAHTHN